MRSRQRRSLTLQVDRTSWQGLDHEVNIWPDSDGIQTFQLTISHDRVALTTGTFSPPLNERRTSSGLSP